MTKSPKGDFALLFAVRSLVPSFSFSNAGQNTIYYHNYTENDANAAAKLFDDTTN